MTDTPTTPGADQSIFSRMADSPIKLHHALLIGLIFLAAFTRIWRLGTPDTCYFDEVYFPTTGALIWHNDDDAWNFIGSENTHPPLSKDFMAIGEGIFGNKDLKGASNGCWPDAEDAAKKSSNAWAFDMFGARFFGAVFGVFSIVFMYLIAKRLFKNEVAALSSAFLLCMDGLVLTQSRIATPDSYVLFFMLGSVYFLLKRRWLLGGLFLGASAASKWIGAFTVIPIILYFAWTSFREWREAGEERSLREAERVMLVGGVGVAAGVFVFGMVYAFIGLSLTTVLAGLIPTALGLFVILGGLVAILTDAKLRSLPRAKVYVKAAYSYPLFFIAVPFAVYMASYIPMFAQGHGLSFWWDLNRSAYEFHSSLTATHPYQSAFWKWPFDIRPVFFYLGAGEAKIYNIGNPMVFWMSLPALAFCAWQAVRNVRIRIERGSVVRVWGKMADQQWVLAFVVICYVGFWLALSTQGRALFLYHYQEALAFAILATGYVIGWLWYHQNPLGRYACIAYLAVVGVTFIYFYPHWTAVDVSQWLDSSYYWFNSWR
ncbi:MAG: phospholipid carrier-dependent glycosyltransferase [Chloroflexota bacterium]